MKRISRLLVIAILGVIIIAALALFGLPWLNGFQKNGTLTLRGLTKPVKVIRDEKGMPYIFAENLSDALMAQGFATAQDRLFQMQLTRLLAEGRISELVGETGKSLDVMMRTIGIHRNAKKHARLLDEKTKRFFQRFVDGVNAFIETRPDSHPIEFKLAGIRPEPWHISDSLALVYFMGWGTSANVKSEIIAQMLVEKVGLEKARQIFSLNINPDQTTRKDEKSTSTILEERDLHFVSDRSLRPYCMYFGHGMGSNNWALSPRFSPSGKPIVADDPHLDARVLPGIWYPSALITPEFRAVGAIVPGIPGMVIGRTDYFAMGVTNAYGDCQDLYVESLDPNRPDHYLEGTQSLPFTTITEQLKIRDKSSPGGHRQEQLKIKFTKRGPVVSGALPSLRTDKVITLRWAAAETMWPKVGLEDLLRARSVDQVRSALSNLTFIVLNMVFADVKGNVGWHVSGKLPIRSQGDSTLPLVVKDGADNWTGWIAFNDMPHDQNPRRGWLGTCNHKTVTDTYPYYFSSYFAPSYRYRRLMELLDRPGVKTVDESWQWQRDTVNLMAKAVAPVMARALMDHEDTNQLGKILSRWDYRDDPGQIAPTIFQLVYRNFARSVFKDELGDELAATLLEAGFFWQERLQKMVMDGDSPWFDNVLTEDKVESMSDLFHQSALDAARELGDRLGPDPDKWQWGKGHRIEFVNPLRREGFGKSLLGKGPYPMGGSRETLCCAWYDYANPFNVILAASLRMVADLGDDEKVVAVLPGGVSGRTFDHHMTDQVEPFMNGEKVFWWFSDRAIEQHEQTRLLLIPSPK